MGASVAWKDVEDARRNLINLVPSDPFLMKICKGAVKAGRDKTNPIRGNLVASALRELGTHVLHSLAPEDEVRSCVWFVQATDTKTVTRGQRARFIVQAGLPNDFVEQKLKVDAGAMASRSTLCRPRRVRLAYRQPNLRGAQRISSSLRAIQSPFERC